MAPELTQDAFDAIAVLMDDCRTEIVEAAKRITTAMSEPPHAALQTALDALSAAILHPPEDAALPLLDEIVALLTPRTVPRPWWHRGRWPAAVVLAAGLGLGAGWWTFAPPRDLAIWAALGSQVDRVLIEQSLALPSSLQQALASVYRGLHIQPPAERKGKRL